MRISSALILVLCGLLIGCAEPKKETPQQNIHYILGVSYLRENNPSRALQEFDKAHKAEPRNPDILIGLGRAYQLRGAYDQAEKYYLQALKEDPEDPLIENNLGDLYLSMERPDDAIHYFSKASSNLRFGNAEVSLTGLGYAHFLKQDYPAAIRAYRQALAQNPRYDEAQLRLGETYYAMGRTDRALGAFRQALKLNGSNVQTHFQLGLAHMELGNFAKARQSFRNVIKLAPLSELGEQAEQYLESLPQETGDGTGL